MTTIALALGWILCGSALVFGVCLSTAMLLGRLVAGHWQAASARLKSRSACAVTDVGFVHPAAIGGGGGERVLWVAIHALMMRDQQQQQQPTSSSTHARTHRRYVVFMSEVLGGPDGRTPLQPREATAFVLAKVKEQFGITIPTGDSAGTVSTPLLELRFLSTAAVAALDPARYPRLTLVLQTVVGASVVLGDMLRRHGRLPPVLVDTVGLPFLYPLAAGLCGVTVVPYVHYPTISTDMLDAVASGNSAFNNDNRIARSGLLTRVKLFYYHAFGLFYRFCGAFVTAPMANSSWTCGHVQRMWRVRPTIVYPPCNVEALCDDGAASTPDRERIIASIGQFRPEKDHLLQLRAFAEALPRLPPGTRLVLAGGARNEADRARVESLRATAKSLGLVEGTTVEFWVSRPYGDIKNLLRKCTVGLHTMRDEHFGIVVVEYLAAGALALAHNSAGPRMDIIPSPAIGRLATTQHEFAEGMVALMHLSPSEAAAMRAAARQQSLRFSDEYFAEQFCATVPF